MKLTIPGPGPSPRPDGPDITPRPPKPIDPPFVPDDHHPDGPMASRIVDSARKLEGVRPGRIIPGVPGNLGCATFVSGALVEAGFDRSIMAANTHDLEHKMLEHGFIKVPE